MIEFFIRESQLPEQVLEKRGVEAIEVCFAGRYNQPGEIHATRTEQDVVIAFGKELPRAVLATGKQDNLPFLAFIPGEKVHHGFRVVRGDLAHE